MSNNAHDEIATQARTEGFWFGVILTSLIWWVFL
jgi:hypothetical protein